MNTRLIGFSWGRKASNSCLESLLNYMCVTPPPHLQLLFLTYFYVLILQNGRCDRFKPWYNHHTCHFSHGDEKTSVWLQVWGINFLNADHKPLAQSYSYVVLVLMFPHRVLATCKLCDVG